MNRTKKLFQETALLLEMYEQETEQLRSIPWLNLFYQEMKTQYESLKNLQLGKTLLQEKHRGLHFSLE